MATARVSSLPAEAPATRWRATTGSASGALAFHAPGAAADRMTAAPAGIAVGAGARPRKLSYESLFSPWADTGMLAIPALAAASAFALAVHRGENASGWVRSSLVWAAAFVLGNTTHVLLTFFLLGTRRDMLHATRGQARTVTLGSALVFAAATYLMWRTRNDVTLRLLLTVSARVFAVHHTESQAKGFWALYSLRGARAGLPAPSARERELQKLFVPLALLFIAIKWTLVGESSWDRAGPFLNVNPSYPAVLPFALTYALVGAWLVYVALLFRALLAYDRLNAAKLVYLGTQCSVVTLELVAPAWGITVGAGIHGLEYFLLTRRMLAPTPEESGSKLTAALCVPALLAAMAPLLLVGALTNPWVSLWPFGKAASGWSDNLVMACGLAHYHPDAFIYRLRIPSVRAVVLGRLGMA